MALPNIEVRVSADTANAEAGFNRVETGLDEMGRAATRANSKVAAINAPMRQVTRTGGGMGRGFQNLGYQINDFAVQVSAGQSATLALNQQLPQLLQGFGLFGVALSVVAAVGIPVFTAMRAMNTEGRDMTEIFGTLQPLVQAIGSGLAAVGEIAVSAAELLVNNIDRILTIGATAAAFFAGKWVAAFIAARIATFSLSTALAALRGALIRTGIGALIVGAGELVFQFTRLVKATGGFSEALAALKDVAVEVFDRIKLAFATVPVAIRAGANAMAGFFLEKLAYMGAQFVEFTWAIAEGLNSLFGTSLRGADASGINGIKIASIEAKDAASAAAGQLASMGAGLGAPIQSLGRIRDILSNMKDERITLPDILGIGGEDEDGSGGGGGKGGKSKASKKLDDELTAQENRIKEHFDRIKALTTGGLSDKLGAWGSYFGNLASLTGSNNDKLLGMQKSFAAAQALIDAWGAHNKVLNDPSLPWWARIASAATVLASGIGAVNAIRSVSKSGGGGGGTAGTGGGTTTDGTAAPAQQPLDVRVSGLSSGQLMDGMDVGRLLERLQDEAGDRGLRITVAR